jgi:ergothioneine biosynthesis protein EgtB
MTFHVDSPVVGDREKLLSRYHKVRLFSETLCKPLMTEDYVVQTMEDVSPPKWHLGHTTWFYEQVVFEQFIKDFHPFRKELYFVFNSYYEAFGERVERPKRGTLSRPTVSEVYEYRKAVDDRMAVFLGDIDDTVLAQVAPLIELGLNHEQQHQELFLTDIKHNLATNPLNPAYERRNFPEVTKSLLPLQFVGFKGGLVEIGAEKDGFAYDNEGPRHQVYLNDFRIANRLVTCGEFLEFINSGGYQNADLWFSDAWATLAEHQWTQPFYWRQIDGAWHIATLFGLKPLNLNEPVCHLSHYEAAAYARWKNKRLPTEAEWELAAQSIETNEAESNFAESGNLHPIPLATGTLSDERQLHQMFGDVWEWTSSAYLPYPGYKFMNDQMVLRGGSCATPRDHFRLTYRNFFQSDKRWQFTGMRLTEDI